MVGSTVGHYQILEKLGAGGMGEIYKAQDPRLNRMVAIKVLSLASAGDPERRRRFVQEAQAASGLNHPNIITIYDIISEGDNEYMVMEYIAGKTLVDVIPKGGLRLPQAIKYAVQIADALSVAHAAGIVHRDLKPANVMITDSGLVKILDFGLAKLTDRGPIETGGGGDATQTIGAAPLTVEGSIIGTLSYMSPEQAQGKKVDARSDVFSFGLLLYEMVTGTRAFSGDNALETLSAILRDEARPIAEIAPDCPPQIEQVVHRTLRKNPDDRWQSMNEVRSALTALMRESDSGTLYRLTGSHTLPPIAPAPPKAQAPAKSKSLLLPMSLIAVGVLLVIGLSVMMVLRRHRTEVTTAAANAATAAEAAKAESAAAPPPADAQPPVPESKPDASVLNNDQIIDMVANKVPQAVILSQIHSSKTDFNLTAPEIIRLSNAGVPSKIIEAMRHPDAIPASVPVPSRTASTPAPPAAQTPPPVVPTPAPVVTPVAPPAAVTTAAPAPPKPAENKAPEKWIEISVTDGTPIQATLAADVAADALEGQPIKLTVSHELRVGDTVVIAKGAAITAEIVEAAKKKFIGTGKMTFKVTKVSSADGKTLSVRATPGKSTDGPARRPVEVPNQKHVKELAAAAGADYIIYIDGAQLLSIKK